MAVRTSRTRNTPFHLGVPVRSQSRWASDMRSRANLTMRVRGTASRSLVVQDTIVCNDRRQKRRVGRIAVAFS